MAMPAYDDDEDPEAVFLCHSCGQDMRLPLAAELLADKAELLIEKNHYAELLEDCMHFLVLFEQKQISGAALENEARELLKRIREAA